MSCICSYHFKYVSLGNADAAFFSFGNALPDAAAVGASVPGITGSG